MSARIEPATRGLYVVAVVDDDAKDEARRFVIMAASEDDARFTARLRAAAENMRAPRIVTLTHCSGESGQ
jgi:hypothetical protein